jgi:hypothetical protein
VTALASLVARKFDWAGGNFRDRIPAVVSILAKASRDNESAYPKEQQEGNYKNHCQSEKVSRIFENDHFGNLAFRE